MTRRSLLAATTASALATSRSSLLILAATVVVGTLPSFSASAAVRGYHPVAGSHFSNAAVTRSRPAKLYSGTVRLGTTKYKPAPGLGSKLPAKVTSPSAIKVTAVPGLKPINIGSKLAPKTTLPTGTTPPSAPKTPAPPANPSTTKGPTNTGSYAVNGAFGHGLHWDSPTTTVAAATLPTKVIDCRGRTEDGGYLTWQRAFNANGEPQLLCVRVFN